MSGIKVFPAFMFNLYEMLSFVREGTAGFSFDSAVISHIELAVEEALVNVIKYAYPENKSETAIIEIEITFFQPTCVMIIIRDEGIPFNPLTIGSKQPPRNLLEDEEMEGYGIFLILNLMDDVKYEREASKNVLTLVKNFSAN